MTRGSFHLGGIVVAAFSVAAWTLFFCLPTSASSLPSSETTSIAGNSRPSSAVTDDGSTYDFYKRLYDFGLGKRAFGTYGPENKRIPSYNFGLGKRLSDRERMYSFGLGKRDKSYGKTYSFGIGKRFSDYYDEEDEEPAMEEEPDEEGEALYGETDWAPEEAKRARQMYSFGLGKRARQYSFGIGKRARSYSFGIGKRYPRYGFGIGKRDDSEEEDAASEIEQAKRRDHRFSFGLGKREVAQGEAESVGEEEKRSRYYDFGLGKRSDEEGESAEKRSDGGSKGKSYVQSGFGRAGRRTYSFGLGKRLPMYDFGLGKRSERAVTSATTVASTPESGNAGKH